MPDDEPPYDEVARRGRRDEAAAFAYGALWRVAEDEAGPRLSRWNTARPAGVLRDWSGRTASAEGADD